ncbi:MAG: zf-TFIIB domain-containing protein [Terriglobia bacterium]
MMNNNVTTQHGHISYNACEQCGSLWLDAGELDKMAFQVEGSIEYCSQDEDGTPEAQPKKCPRCEDSVLDRVRFLKYSDIILHCCGNCCGFWLDGGELNLINKELRKIMPVQGKGFSDFVNHVHVPYWHKQIRRKSSEVDFHVEVEPIQGAKEQGTTTDICPRCEHTLNFYEVFSMRFEGCPKCKGIWLFEDELRKLKNKVDHGSLRWMNDEIEAIETTSARVTNRRCVKCKTVKMVSVLFGKSSILIDWCPRCRGMWLDRDEFESIVEYLKSEESDMKPKEIEQEAVQEAKRIWSGGPEGRFDEFRDAGAALSALISATIFEHPKLFNFLEGFKRGEGFPG